MLNFLATAFNVILYKPLFNLLILLYDYIPGKDFGIAVIFLTLIIRVIVYPLSVRAVKSQKVLQAVQPKVQEIQKKYKNDKEKQAKEVFELYKKEKINPFSGLFLTLIQLPILIALYRVFWNGLKSEELANLYNFVLNPGHISPIFLGIFDLSKPNLWFAIAAAALQFFQTKMFIPKVKSEEKKSANEPDFSKILQKQMLYFSPVLTMIILVTLPSALGLYWAVSGIFSIIQQYFILKKQ